MKKISPYLMLVILTCIAVNPIPGHTNGFIVSKKEIFSIGSINSSKNEIQKITGSNPIELPIFSREGLLVSIIKYKNFIFTFVNSSLLFIELRSNKKIKNFNEAPYGLEQRTFIVEKSNFFNHTYTSIELALPGICGSSAGVNTWHSQIEIHQNSHIIYRLINRKVLQSFCKAQPVAN